jgi:hypothetical protein
MSGSIQKCNTHTTYTITHPDWICEWIVNLEGPIKRSCYLTSNLDPLKDVDDVKKIMPGLVTCINTVITQWIEEGNIDARRLLEVKPSLVEYAERILLQINQQG